MILDLASLRFIWWLLLGILLIGFAIFDGFDLGIATIYNVVAKNDHEKRIILNTIGPVWESNQVWFITAAAAMFAAWPLLYAIAFSGLYFIMFIILIAFILRPVCIKYRSKVYYNNKWQDIWQNTWDILFAFSGIIPSFLFGIVIGNVMQGLPFTLNNDLQTKYLGTFWQLFNPYAIICGLLVFMMFINHGCQFLALKTEGRILKRANKISFISSVLIILLFCIGGFLIKTQVSGYIITDVMNPVMNHSGPSNPLYKEVTTMHGAWMHNFYLYPYFWIAPILGFSGALVIFVLSNTNLYKLRLLFSAFIQLGIISTFGLAMFPFILPSSIQFNASLTLWDSSSSKLTLFTMLLVVTILLPIIMCYVSWVYYILRGKITIKDVDNNLNAY